MKGAGLVDVDGMDGTSPPTIVGHAAPGNLVRIWLPTGIAAGTAGSPALKTDAILMVRSTAPASRRRAGRRSRSATRTPRASPAPRRAGPSARDGSVYDLFVADC
jgi:hypothetical protein